MHFQPLYVRSWRLFSSRVIFNIKKNVAKQNSEKMTFSTKSHAEI